MLEFNPYFRATASHLLKFSIFDSIRTGEMEVKASKKIRMACDEQGAFDYDNIAPIGVSIQ